MVSEMCCESEVKFLTKIPPSGLVASGQNKTATLTVTAAKSVNPWPLAMTEVAIHQQKPRSSSTSQDPTSPAALFGTTSVWSMVTPCPSKSSQASSQDLVSQPIVTSIFRLAHVTRTTSEICKSPETAAQSCACRHARHGTTHHLMDSERTNPNIPVLCIAAQLHQSTPMSAALVRLSKPNTFSWSAAIARRLTLTHTTTMQVSTFAQPAPASTLPSATISKDFFYLIWLILTSAIVMLPNDNYFSINKLSMQNYL